jgi:hypothetical protein
MFNYKNLANSGWLIYLNHQLYLYFTKTGMDIRMPSTMTIEDMQRLLDSWTNNIPG